MHAITAFTTRAIETPKNGIIPLRRICGNSPANKKTAAPNTNSSVKLRLVPKSCNWVPSPNKNHLNLRIYCHPLRCEIHPSQDSQFILMNSSTRANSS